ncbi:MAG: hypothetical protein ACK5RL_06865 [Acidimicrobiales bacterium]
MIRRALLITDGPSDAPLGEHLEIMCAERGVEIRVTSPDLRRLPNPPSFKIEDRLRAVFDIDDAGYDLLFVHRDAEKQDPRLRHDEVRTAVSAVCHGRPYVPVVPIRMTEAWLLLDEQLIREVAGRPDGAVPLKLPTPNQVESLPNPKSTLQLALETASELKGRRMRQFQNRFNENRRLLLQRLDRGGPVTGLKAWKALERSIDEALRQF